MVDAFRHANTSEIVLDLRFDPRRLVLICRDHGRGIGSAMLELESPDRHFGLLGTRERARKVRGELTISQGQPKGTIVVLKVSARVAYRRRRWK